MKELKDTNILILTALILINPILIARMLIRRQSGGAGKGWGKGKSNSHGARPVHPIITMIKWIRTSRLTIKNSLSGERPVVTPSAASAERAVSAPPSPGVEAVSAPPSPGVAAVSAPSSPGSTRRESWAETPVAVVALTAPGRMVHLGRFTCHAISGRGDKSTDGPTHARRRCRAHGACMHSTGHEPFAARRPADVSKQ